jgi:hypothetical protein
MKHVSEILPAIVNPEMKPLTPIQQRLLTMPDDGSDDIVYQHSVLCQTSMPYRNPGDEVRLWQRENGRVSYVSRLAPPMMPVPACGSTWVCRLGRSRGWCCFT